MRSLRLLALSEDGERLVLAADEPDNVKIGVKLVVTVLAVVTVFLAARKQRAAAAGQADPKSPLPFFHTTARWRS